MLTKVPSLEGQLYLTDPQSIIGYVLRRYSRTPKDTVTILPDMIISLPWQIAQYGKDPDTLTSNIKADLQNVFNRIFNNERKITVSASQVRTSATTYDISLSVIYTILSGELQQFGTTLSLDKSTGRLIIPEDQIQWINRSYG